MKLLSGILGLTLTSVVALASANAADLSGPAMGGLKDGPYGPSWAGFYFGVNVGGAWGDIGVSDFVEDGNTFKNSTSGFLGGIQWGYNQQFGNIVFGPEFDIGWLGLNHSAANPIDADIVSSIKDGIYGDLTLRVGYGFDRALIYAKGGLAFYDGNVKVSDLPEGGVSPTTTRIGWTAGGGVEYKINPSWSVKGEYLYFDFGGDNTVMSSDVFDVYNQHLTAHTVKVGVNFFPGFVYEPLK